MDAALPSHLNVKSSLASNETHAKIIAPVKALHGYMPRVCTLVLLIKSVSVLFKLSIHIRGAAFELSKLQ